VNTGILTRALAEIRSLDALSRQSSSVHSLDPRAKLILVFTFVVVVMSFSPYTIQALIPFFSFPIWLATAGRIPFRALIWKLVIILPLAILVGVLNPFLDTAPRSLPVFGVVAQGWISLGSIILRFLLNASAGLLLIGTTGAMPIAQALTALRFPNVLSTLFLLIYRYLFILTDEFIRLNQARQCRSAGGSRLSPSVAGALIGSVLLRTWDRAERITNAMRLRGFTGPTPLSSPLKWTVRDTQVVLIWLILFGVFRLSNLPDVFGRLFLSLLP